MRLIHYTNGRLSSVCVPHESTLREAMAVMNAHSLRLVPIVDAEQRLRGVLADGDIRRHLAGPGTPDDPVSQAANARPTVCESPLESRNARAEMQRRGVEYLPVTSEGRITDLYVLWAINAPLELTAVIMAGGLGSRLSPHTDNCPKPLIELGGKPILTHIIEHLRGQGVRRFVLAVNYLSQMIVNQYGDGSALDVSIDYVHETKRLGTGGALSLIAPEKLSEPFLSMNGDILTDIDVNALFDAHRDSGWAATMVTREFQYAVPYGVVRKSAEGHFEGSDEKPTLSFPINAGIYMLSREALPIIPRDTFFDLPTLFDQLRHEGLTAGTFGHDGRWIDIGTQDELQRARAIFERDDT